MYLYNIYYWICRNACANQSQLNLRCSGSERNVWGLRLWFWSARAWKIVMPEVVSSILDLRQPHACKWQTCDLRCDHGGGWWVSWIFFLLFSGPIYKFWKMIYNDELYKHGVSLDRFTLAVSLRKPLVTRAVLKWYQWNALIFSCLSH